MASRGLRQNVQQLVLAKQSLSKLWRCASKRAASKLKNPIRAKSHKGYNLSFDLDYYRRRLMRRLNGIHSTGHRNDHPAGRLRRQ